jgi:hypothetical protein
VRKHDNNIAAFYALLRAGLWDEGANLLSYVDVDFSSIYQLAEEQSVVGLITAGLENVKDMQVPKNTLLTFIGRTMQIEQHNKAMNEFIGVLIRFLRKNGIYSLLVKGQGIAQCYEKSLWRACGDVDLLLDSDNYELAKSVLTPKAIEVQTEYTYFKHLAMTIDGWEVELHGTRQSRLSRRIDSELDIIQESCFKGGDVRAWQNGKTDIFLPGVNADVLFIFTHIMHHFYFEGVGIRQVCDWCRLMWTYRDEIDVDLLEQRLRKMKLMSEWRAFAAYAVDWLGMPVEAIPLYSKANKWSRKAGRINTFVLKVGNFGHNNEKISRHKPYLIRKFLSLLEHMYYVMRHFMIFPLDSLRFMGEVIRSGFHGVVNGE